MMDTAEDDGIGYRIAHPEDEDVVKEMFFNELFKRETISVGLKMIIPRECRAFVDIEAPRACRSGLSILAFDISSNQVVGVRSTILATPENPETLTFPKDDENCRKLNLMCDLSNSFMEGKDFFQEYGVNKLAYFRGLAVKSKYCQRGIALRMVQESLEACKAQDCRLVIGVSSGFYSQCVFERAGFRTIKILAYKDYFIEGRQLIPCEGKHTSIRLHVKEL